MSVRQSLGVYIFIVRCATCILCGITMGPRPGGWKRLESRVSVRRSLRGCIIVERCVTGILCDITMGPRPGDWKRL